MARRIAKKTGCPVMTRDKDGSRWWPILYVGRNAGKDDLGSYTWKLRDELAEALDKTDLSQVELYAASTLGEEDRGYWWLNANPEIWSFSDISVGDVQSYTLYNDNGNKRRIFQNFLDAKAGDMIICYESNPVKQIVALGKVSAKQDGEKIYFEKTEGLSSPIDYQTLKSCSELEKMEYFSNQQGSLFKLTKGEYDFIIDMIRDKKPLAQAEKAGEYNKSDFLDEVYMTESRYEMLLSVLERKKTLFCREHPVLEKPSLQSDLLIR